MLDDRNPTDPLRRDAPFDPNVRATTGRWGWVVGAAFVVVVLAALFGLGHAPNQTDNNTLANNTPPPSAQIAPAPSGPAHRAYSPAPLNPGSPAPPNSNPPQQQ